jgi:hypothetical protein
MKNEIWKDVPNYEGHYKVSNYGRLKTLKRNKERLMSPAIGGTNYLQVLLYKNSIRTNFKLHQIVAMAFLGHIPKGHNLVVDHIDNNKLNNRLENLQIISNRENISKDKKGYTSQYVGVSWDKRQKKWSSNITLNRIIKRIGFFKDEFEAHLAYQKALNEINNTTK